MPEIAQDKLNIGRALLAAGPVTQQRLQEELERSGKGQSVLGKALLQSGFPREEELIAPLLARLRIPRINARNTKIPLETIRLIPEDVAKRGRVLAIDQIGVILVVVTPDLGSDQALADVRKATGCLVTPIQCPPEGFDEIVGDYYARLAESGLGAAAPVATTGGAPAPAQATNGTRHAIPAGADHEDSFWRRYMSAGPLPADESLM